MIRLFHISIFLFSVSVLSAQQNNQPVTNSNSAPAQPLIENVIPDSTVNISNEKLEMKEGKSSRGVKAKDAVPMKKSKADNYKAIEQSMDESIGSESEEIDFDGLSDDKGGATTGALQIQSANVEFRMAEHAVKTQNIQRSPTYSQQQEMDQVVDYLEVNAPGSFEYNYFNYVAGNYDTDLIEYLEVAESIRPENSDVHVQKAGYHLIMNEESEAASYLSKLVESKRLYDVQDYCTDLLLSVPLNGTLITHGFDDTYGSEYMQILKSKRPDVEIVSLDFMQSETYRTNLIEQGFTIPKNTEVIDVNFFENFCSLNESKKLAISMTLPKDYLVPVQSKLYATGLVFEYHSESFENLERNKKLWNNKLEKHLITGAETEKEKRLSSNYLPMLLILYKDVKLNGTEGELKDIETALDKVSVQCNKYNQVKSLKGGY